MINFRITGVTSRDIELFSRYQKRIFFSKTDLALPAKNFNSINKQAIDSIIYEKFKIHPQQIVLLKPSTNHKVYQVKCANLSYIVRFALVDKLFKSLNFIKQKWVMEKLTQKKLPAIKIYQIDFSRKNIACDFSIEQSAQGKTLYDLFKENNSDIKLFFKLGQFVANIHSIKTKKFGPLDISSIIKSGQGLGIYNSWSKYLLLNLETHLKVCLDIKAIDSKTYLRIKQVFTKLVGIVSDVSPRLLHGDLANHNIFSDGKKITAIIDWEDCISGDPIFDIAFFGTGAFRKKIWFNQFIKGYQTQQKLPKDFNIRYWLYYLRISISKTVIRHKLQLPENSFTKNHLSRINKSLNKLESLIK